MDFAAVRRLPEPSRKRLAELAAAKLARESLTDFCCYTDPTQAQNYQAHHLQRIAGALERVERGECKRLFITCPPRHWKSSLGSEKFPQWFLGRNPTKSVGLVSNAANLATGFSRNVRDTIIGNPRYRNVFSCQVNQSSSAINEWSLIGTYRTSFRAFGVESSITGAGFDLVVIDDPVADNQAAFSKTKRDSSWEWYKQTLRDRLEPGGALVLIMCMTGDTRVLMADGSERELSRIKAGDAIATYDSGKITTSTVKNWKNQGKDIVFTIRMESGITLKANGKHPFLVSRKGILEWKMLKDLLPGENMLRVNGENGKGLNALLKGAVNQSAQGDVAKSITTKQCTPVDTGHLQSIPSQTESDESSTDTESLKLSSKSFRNSRAESAQSAKGCQTMETVRHTGQISCASTMTTRPEKCEDYCAMIATSQSVTVKQKNDSEQQQTTYEIVHDRIVEIVQSGVEDVFDIEVERTENFIANGFVSHNSRWHQDDMAGRLLQASKTGDGEPWEVLHMPAIVDGKALWAQRWPLDELARIKRGVGSRAWAARFLGDPKPDDGNLLNSAKLVMVDPENVPPMVRTVRRWDLAFSDRDGSDWLSGAKLGIDEREHVYILHVRRVHGRWTQGKPVIIETAQADGIDCTVYIESNGTQLGYADDIKSDSRMRNRTVLEDRPEGNKEMRASIWGTRLVDGIIHCVRGEWNGELFDQMDYFPSAEHDDDVDAISGAYAKLTDVQRIFVA